MTYQKTLSLKTNPKTFHDITREVQTVLSESKAEVGLCNLFIQHTSASLLITENADPDVRRDLENYFSDIVSESRDYIHDAEGKDDMPAHIRTVLTQTSLSIPFANGCLQLGTWQGVYLWEHRDWVHTRKVLVTVL